MFMNVSFRILWVLVLIAGRHQAAAQNFALSSSPSVGRSPYSVVATELNGDGKQDLISVNSGDNSLTVLTNNGNGTFTVSATLQVGNVPSFLVAADVNDDGRMDLI